MKVLRWLLCCIVAACVSLGPSPSVRSADLRGATVGVRVRGHVEDAMGAAVADARIFLVAGVPVPDGPPDVGSVDRFADAATSGTLDGALQSTPLDGSLQSTPFDGALQTTPLAHGLRYPTGPLRPARVLTGSRSDLRGDFAIDVPKIGHFVLQVLGPERDSLASREVVVQGATATLELGTIVLGRPWTVRGRVVLPPGRNPQEALVYVPGGDRWVRPGAEGNFLLDGVAPGTAAVAAVADGLRPVVTPMRPTGGSVQQVGELVLVEPSPVIRRLQPEVVAPGTEVQIEGDHFGAWRSTPWSLWVGDVRVPSARRLDDTRLAFTWPANLEGGGVRVEVGEVRSRAATVSVVASWSIEASTASLTPGETWEPGLVLRDGKGHRLPDAGIWSWSSAPDWASREGGAWRAGRPGVHAGVWSLGGWKVPVEARVSSHQAGLLLDGGRVEGGLTEGTVGLRMFQPAWVLPGPHGGWWFCDRRSGVRGSLPELSEIRHLDGEGRVRVVRAAAEVGGSRWTHAARVGRGVVVVDENTRGLDIWQPEATRTLGVDVPAGVWTSLPSLPGLGSHDGLPGPIAWHPDWGLAQVYQSANRWQLVRLAVDGQWHTEALAIGPTFPEPTEPALAPDQALVRAYSLAWTSSGTLVVGTLSRVWAWPMVATRVCGRPVVPGRMTSLVGHGGLDGGPVPPEPDGVSLRVVSGLLPVGPDLWIADGNHGRLIVLDGDGHTYLAGGEGSQAPIRDYVRLLDQKWIRPGPLAQSDEGDIVMLDKVAGMLMRLVPTAGTH
ncbi:MAG: carboxypeptidase-like regulatory domain-containing protein [Candidatus Sericytochromatia bacterium]|nr:carboxypeptidase-like regulatory domain-containing protein [Candidatus Sericytochromatia bacterium]